MLSVAKPPFITTSFFLTAKKEEFRKERKALLFKPDSSRHPEMK